MELYPQNYQRRPDKNNLRLNRIVNPRCLVAADAAVPKGKGTEPVGIVTWLLSMRF